MRLKKMINHQKIQTLWFQATFKALYYFGLLDVRLLDLMMVLGH
jgi:hypothetical protein